MRIQEFQNLIETIYFEKDSRRGLEKTFLWFLEEVGELARAIRGSDVENLHEEFADVFAWLSTLASLTDISLEEAVGKYTGGCPRCASTPCACME